MAKQYVLWLLVRFVLPAALLLSISLRPFGFSILYLLLFLWMPLLRTPDSKTLSGCPGRALLVNVFVSCLLLILNIVWHIVILIKTSALQTCSLAHMITMNLGLINFKNVEPIIVIQNMAPELIMTIASLAVFFSVRKILKVPLDQITPRHKDTNCQEHPFLTTIGKYLTLFLIMFSGVLKPSITSGLYYLVFIGAATAWSLGQSLERGFAVVGRCLMAFMAVHTLTLLSYQFIWIMELAPPDDPFPRYFGLTQLVEFNCTSIPYFEYSPSGDMWGTIASPIVILITYYILALETRQLFKPKVACPYIDTNELRGSSSETTPLIRGISHSPSKKKLSSIRSRYAARTVHQDSTGSVIISDEESMMEYEKPTVLDEIITVVIEIFQVLIRSSYIATSIAMMAWSILFHSWLTFVLLMWANIIWLCPNQRKSMLRSSPLLVCYSIFLLLAQYVYGMDLTEEELPSTISDVNLKQIGLSRASGAPCVPLMIKSLFACMFWITLRQHVQAKRERRQSTIIADMAAPLQLTVSTATSALEKEEKEKKSRFFLALGKSIRAVCVRCWIYVVVIMLFVIGITGERMTIFRIIYMFLFLSFILLFQISWHWWRRLMYAFWITVIIYSMITLVFIYIYQFDNFPQTMERTLRISVKLQYDLGLEQYRIADLFLKLLTPTSFLIITIIQVHYFHSDFMELSARQSSSQMAGGTSSRPSQAGASTIKDDVPALPLEEEEIPSSDPNSITETDVALGYYSITQNQKRRPSLFRRQSKTQSYQPTVTEQQSKSFQEWTWAVVRKLRKSLSVWQHYFFLFLELHYTKIVFLAVMLLCVVNVCAIHVPLMMFVILGLLVNKRNQRLCIILISTLMCCYFMAHMIYQIDYIRHSYFDVNCTFNDTKYYTLNNAEWVGFKKATNQTLSSFLDGYISVIAILIFYSIITYRQKHYGSAEVISTNKDKVMFPEVARKDADLDMPRCVKYLVNYGFYKFGVEITLICLMGVIGSRMDVYAVLYAGWLLLLVSISRQCQASLWPTFTISIVVLIPIQYMLAVGFLPQFCIEYPWDGNDEQTKHLRAWLFLPYTQSPPHATKLVFDFVLLLLCCRQWSVFRIENKHGDNYPGGSNSDNIGQDWETPNFVNPVPDFLGFVGSWLDIVKRIIFLGMLWFTLAVMFLTGTNRVNLFSMGYLIGSFVFLWQGTDFYLRPKDTILRWWSWLLRYNVCVVVVKTVLQIPGCLFTEVVQEHSCWLVQLLGVGCVDKFAGGTIKTFLKMDTIRTQESVCLVPQEDIGLAWDGVCFAFLLLQRRLFQSYYFYRVIDESKATTMLASRGAELIEELRQKRMKQQEEREKKVLEKIKEKMERIKANQLKLQGSTGKTPTTHETDSATQSSVRRRVISKRHEATHDRPMYQKHSPTSHQKAIRSGDYFMFDESSDVDLELEAKSSSDSSDDEQAPKEMGIGKTRYSGTAIEPVKEAPVEAAPIEPESEVLAYEPLQDKETWFEKVKRYLNTAGVFVNSFIVSITCHLLKYSRDYRYVSTALSHEKNVLKNRHDFGIGIRQPSQMIWEPIPESERKTSTTMGEHDDSMFKQDKSPLVHLGYALWFSVLAHTDIVCYLMVFFNQIQSATILSIPLPLMVFLWGSLTIPRPTKTFWVTLIAYTECIVLLKSMFQFEILPWNQKVIPANMPFTAPRIIGIERKSNYALYDLLLLLIIFLHRFMLKSLGLWKQSPPESEVHSDMQFKLRPEDTEMILDGRGKEVGQHYVEVHAMSVPEDNEEKLIKATETDQNDEAGPSKPPDDDHYKVDDEKEPIILVTTTLEDVKNHYPSVMLLSLKRYLRPVYQFFLRMREPGARVTADVYAYMFLCDFLNFLVVIFGFAAFGTHQGDGGVQAYLEENKVPTAFLIMLILQFTLIVIDRALYLRKYILGKILFQYALIIGVHLWMFFVLPLITERSMNSLLPPPLWYMIKCVYLLLSAYQIRCGYPRRIIGNFLCKKFGYLNMALFRGFMSVPFIFELRTLMDWIWTDSSMTLMDWLKMEDVFANVFLLKCSRYVDDEFPQARGIKKSTVSKYILGGAVLTLVIAIIWFPLVFFALGNSVGTPNPPEEVTVKIRIGPYLPVYLMSAQSHNIDLYSEHDYAQLSNFYSRDRTAQTFLSNYLYNDIAVVSLNTNSTSIWEISPPEYNRLQEEALSNQSLLVKFTYVITHVSNNVQNPSTIEESKEVVIPAFSEDGKRNPNRVILSEMLAGTSTSLQWFNVSHIFPKFVKVLNKGIAKPTDQLIPQSWTRSSLIEQSYRDILMRLEVTKRQMYWRVKEDCSDYTAERLKSIPKNNCELLAMYTFNDKLFPNTLNFISGSGIIGLYTTFVFLASRVLRGFFSGMYSKIMFDDLPNVDRVLQLCLDIYLVREAQEFSLEEDLFAKLVFLYRSPETMIKWSRPKEEGEDDRELPSR